MFDVEDIKDFVLSFACFCIAMVFGFGLLFPWMLKAIIWLFETLGPVL